MTADGGGDARGRGAQATGDAAGAGGPPSGADRAIGAAAGAAAVLIWAGWVVAARVAVSDEQGPRLFGGALGPADVALLRNLGPALLLAPLWLKPSLRESLAPRRTPPAALLGLVAWGAPFVILITIGLSAADTALGAALVPGSMPLFAAAIAYLALGRAPRASQRMGLILIAAGAAAAVAGADPEGLTGAPWLVAAAVSWACFAVAFPVAQLSPARAAGLVGVWSVLIALVAIAAAPGASRLAAQSIDALALGFLTHGVLAGVVSVLAFGVAINRLGPGAAALAALVPGTAALMGWAAIGDPITALGALSLGLASVGVLLVNRPPPRRGL